MAASKVSGVTPENWHTLAKNFITLNGGKGAVIVRDKWKSTTEYPITLKQFGAWLNYFHMRRIPCLAIENTGRATVPTQWPYEFDADWGAGNDEQAGDMFDTSWRRRFKEFGEKSAEAKAAAEAIKKQQPDILAKLEGL